MNGILFNYSIACDLYQYNYLSFGRENAERSVCCTRHFATFLIKVLNKNPNLNKLNLRPPHNYLPPEGSHPIALSKPLLTRSENE